MSEQALSGLEVGQKVFIRTVTYFYIGKVESINVRDIELSDASWVARTAQFNEMLLNGHIDELEVYVDNCFVTWQSIVDYTEWRHNLPKEQPE